MLIQILLFPLTHSKGNSFFLKIPQNYLALSLNYVKSLQLYCIIHLSLFRNNSLRVHDNAILITLLSIINTPLLLPDLFKKHRFIHY